VWVHSARGNLGPRGLAHSVYAQHAGTEGSVGLCWPGRHWFHTGSCARASWSAEQDGDEHRRISGKASGPRQGALGPRRTTPLVPHWTRPELVCEVAFTEWTPEGTLRHPSFQGLRDDKDPTDVIKDGKSHVVARYRKPHSMPRGDKPCHTAYRPC